MTEECKACYRKMFPDVTEAAVKSGLNSGKVFSYEIEKMGLAPGKRRVYTALGAWEECRRYPDFDHCYKLSMAKLALQSAIRDAT